MGSFGLLSSTSNSCVNMSNSMSESMEHAIKETNRRRAIQIDYNKEHNIVPKTIIKEIKEVISNNIKETIKKETKLTKKDKEIIMRELELEMRKAAKELDFEKAMQLRDALFELQSEK